MTRCAAAVLGIGLLALLGAGAAGVQDPAGDLKKVLNDKEVQGPWIYNDLARGLAEAKGSGKPLLVVFR